MPSKDEEPSLDKMMREVDSLPNDDPDWIDLQWYVANALHQRFLDKSDPNDLNEAIRRGMSVVERQGRSSAAHLHDAALMIWDRFAEKDNPEDLTLFVELLETALERAEKDGTDLELIAKCQANLATGLMEGTAADVPEPVRQRAIALWKSALASGQLNEDAKRGIEANLALSLSHAGESQEELQRIVDSRRRAVAEATTSEDAAIAHFNLAAALEGLHDTSTNKSFLDKAIYYMRNGLDLLGINHRDYPRHTANLVALLRRLSRESGNPDHVKEAVCLGRKALKRIPDDDSDRPLILTNTASAILETVKSDSDLGLIDEALSMYREAINIAPEGSQDQGVAMVNLVSACRDANELNPDSALLDEALTQGNKALELFSHPDLYRAAALTAVGNAQRDRYRETGSLNDLDEALKHTEEALALTPKQHPERAARLTNLAVLLSDDFEERADRSQLDHAIELYRQALSLHEPVASRVSERRNDLALALRDRYRDTENSQDLDEAIDLAQQAAAASAIDELTYAGYVNNLANALSERYERDHKPADLTEAINWFNEALVVSKNRPTEASGYETNIGIALAARAQDTGSMDDMDQALLHMGRSIDLLPTSHPDRAYRISNLSDAYRQRSLMFQEGGHHNLALEDAKSAVTTAQEAVAAAGSSDARLLPALSNLAQSLRWLEHLVPGVSQSQKTLEAQRQAALLEGITPAEKFGQSARWARDAEAIGDYEEAFKAFKRAVSLTTQVAWIGLTLRERRKLLTDMQEVLEHAVAHAANQRRLEAFAWADHVRSVLWRQGLQARSLAEKKEDEQWASLSGFISNVETDRRRSNMRPDEQLRLRAHEGEAELGQTVPDPYAYQGLGADGPIVLLAPGEEKSLALILKGDAEPLLIHLPKASKGQLREQVEKLQAKITDNECTYGSESDAIFDCLGWLWENVTAPILKRITTAEERPHVWWSPLGEFALLPVHAAGIHPRRKPQINQRKNDPSKWPNMHERVISSYLPTILLVDSHPEAENGPLDTVLHVSVDPSEQLISLEDERQVIDNALPQAHINHLFDDNATISAFRAALTECTLLHVSAHGWLDRNDSFEAGIDLFDGRFTLRDLAASRADKGQLAVLLTCDSASGDFTTPNEALHVAGAAQQAGFKEVVAATLPVRDDSVVPFVTTLYADITAEPVDKTFAPAVAQAMTDAVDKLRMDSRYAVDPLSWVPYAHFSSHLR
jgi:tetratricopeptide repeat-containing protein